MKKEWSNAGAFMKKGFMKKPLNTLLIACGLAYVSISLPCGAHAQAQAEAEAPAGEGVLGGIGETLYECVCDPKTYVPRPQWSLSQPGTCYLRSCNGSSVGQCTPVGNLTAFYTTTPISRIWCVLLADGEDSPLVATGN